MSFDCAFITDTNLFPNTPKNYGNGTQMQEETPLPGGSTQPHLEVKCLSVISQGG